jgi:hypothetical protein
MTASAGALLARHCRRPRPRLLVVAACVGWLLAAPAAGAAARPDPTADIPLGPLPRACFGAPTGAVCERASIARLDAARAKLGLGPYRLPAHFAGLRPARQLLILANLDRLAYSLAPVHGLSPALDAIAKQGALERTDPNPLPALSALRGQTQIGFASNWAGGAPNAPVAYYDWMYDDGYGSGNLDCTSPSAPGCWGHRHTILAFATAATLTMGAAAVRAGLSYALTIVETSTAVWHYSYTWAQVDLPSSVKWPGRKTSKAVPVSSRGRNS